MDSNQSTLPPPKYIDIFLPDGKHSGVRVDIGRGIIEIRRRQESYFFDLTQIAAMPIDNEQHMVYNG